MMNRLRFLKIENGNLSKGLEYLPNSLRILDWMGYPAKFLPSHFNPQKLFELRLCHSCIKHVRIGNEALYNLKTIDLSHSLNLVNTPNFKGMPNLEVLFLEGCLRLYEVDPTIEVLARLTVLNLKDCKNLVHFASSVSGLKSLKVLNLTGCSKINRLPYDMGHLESLEELHLSDAGIRELPTSIGMLERLSLLNMEDCKNLACLPISVGGLKSLKVLNLSGCLKLNKLPDELCHVACLEKLDVSRSGVREMPSSIGLLKNLRELSLAGCTAHSSKCWSRMFNPFQSLLKRSCVPAGLSLANLSGLHSLTELDLSGCNLSEEAIPSDFGCLASLRNLNLSDNQFVDLPESISQLASLGFLILSKNQFVKLPESIRRLSRLEYLDLNGCHKLQTLPELPSVVNLHLSNCISLNTLVGKERQGNPVLQARCVNCFKMVEMETCGSIALSLLARHLKFRRFDSFDDQTFNFICPGNEIPEWYSYQSVGSSVTVELHPGWLTDKFMGFTSCAVFEPVKPLPSGFKYWSFSCRITANEGFVSEGGPLFTEEIDLPELDHIRFTYLHRDRYGSRYKYPEHEWQDIYYQLVFSFRIRIGSGVFDAKVVEAKKCGLRLVYKEDAEELWQRVLKQSNVGINTKRGLQHYDNNEDADASSSATQSPPKKFKQLQLEGA